MAGTPKKKRGVQRRPRDPRNRHNLHPNTGGRGGPPSDPSPLQGGGGNIGRLVLSVGGSVCRGGSLAAASASVAVPPAFCATSQGGGARSVIDLSSPANADIDEDAGAAAAYQTTAKNPLVAMEADNANIDEDADAGAAAAYWTTAMNPLVAMEAMAREDGDDNNGEFSDAVERSAVAHRLKRNTSSKDLLFTPQQLKNILKSLIENRTELLEFAVRADSHRPSSAVQLAPQLVAALPVLHKKKQQKESMADRITEIYFIWREVARCPQVPNSLPHVRTKLMTVLEDFTLSLVRVHTFCRAELEEERNTTKVLMREDIW